MKKLTKEHYFADDGTPFEENKEACEVYDALYHKVYRMIYLGRVLFWNYKGELMNHNPKIYGYTWNADDKLCYYDWLKKQLRNIAYFRICADINTPEFNELWGLLNGLLNFNSSRTDTLFDNYQTGDTCMFDNYTCRYVNQDDVARRFIKVREELDAVVPKDFEKFMEGLCK